MKIHKILTFLLLSIATFSFAAEAPSVKPFNARFMGMGNSGVAIANDHYLLYQNPAGLGIPKEGVSKDSGILTVLGLGVQTDPVLAKDVYNAVKGVKDSMDNGDGPFEAVDKNKDKLAKVIGKNVGFGVNGPLYLGYTGDGWGFVLADALYANISVSRHAIPYIGVQGNAVVDFKFGMAFPISILSENDFIIGVAPKAFLRGDVDIEKNIVDMDNLPDEISDSMGFGLGGGVDTGILFKLPFLDGSRVGLAVDDILSYYDKMAPNPNSDELISKGTKRIQPNLRVGAYLDLSFLTANLFGLKAAIDVNHLFDSDYPNLANKLHLGAELSFFDFLYVRAGLNQGYMTAGLGIDLFILRLDYAYFQREAGLYPGNRVETTHAVSFYLAF